jgi:hypothetical protein
MSRQETTDAAEWQRRVDEAEAFLRPYLSVPRDDGPPVTLAGYHGPQIVRNLAGLITRLEREAVERAAKGATDAR